MVQVEGAAILHGVWQACMPGGDSILIVCALTNGTRSVVALSVLFV